eukprot:scaffold2968_cov321-Pinguiococcus_pyrenoidosus.AAC.5
MLDDGGDAGHSDAGHSAALRAGWEGGGGACGQQLKHKFPSRLFDRRIEGNFGEKEPTEMGLLESSISRR